MKQYDLALAGNSNAAAIVGHVNIGVGNTLHAHAGFNQSGDNKTTAVGARFDHNINPNTTLSLGAQHTRTNDRDLGSTTASSQSTRRYTEGNNIITETSTHNTTTHHYFQGEKLSSVHADVTQKINNVIITGGVNASDSNINGNKVGGRIGVGYDTGATRVGAEYQRLNGENIYSVASTHRVGNNWEVGVRGQHNATTKDNAVMGTLTYYFGDNNENSRYQSNTSHINNITHAHPASHIPQHKGRVQTRTTGTTTTEVTAIPDNPPTIEIPK